MTPMKVLAIALLLALTSFCNAQTTRTSIPPSFESTGADRQSIEVLLDTCARAVSTKDQALFETLLLNKEVPFSDAYSAAKPVEARQPATSTRSQRHSS